MDTNNWASLPSDLLVEILRRLDTATSAAVALAGVCKPWRRAIVANISSLQLRPDRFNPNLLLGFFHRHWLAGRHLPRFQHVPGPFDKMLPPDMAAVDGKLYDEPLSSRDGFVLLGGRSAGGLCLCNPLAGTCRFIPPPAFGVSSRNPCRFVLVTDHDDPDAGGVRILAVKESDYDYHYRVRGVVYQVFFSDSGEWGPVRCSAAMESDRVRVCLCDGDKDVVVCRGFVVYWLVTEVAFARHGENVRGRRYVLAVDVNDDRTWTVELPETIKAMGLYVSDSMLAMVTTEDGRLSLVTQLPGQPMQVWVLGGGEWTMRRRIDVEELIPRNCLDVGHVVHISGFCPRSGCLFGDVDGEDILFDVEKGVVRRTRRYGVGRVTKYPYEMDWATYISKMKYF